MNLALVNCRTHEVKIYTGKEEVARATFGRSLYADELEAIRADPTEFLKQFDVANTAPEAA